MRLIQPELQKSGKRNRYIAVLGPWLIFVAICGLVAILFSLVTTQGIGVSSGITGQPFYCDTSDTIRYAYATIGADQSSPYWDSNLFLSVTMGFHGLTFAQAKAIDICFDLMIGRGSQVLLALATYPVLRRAVLRSMEVREFSLALLLPFFMERFSVNTLYVMIANMRVDRNEKSGSAAECEGQSTDRLAHHAGFLDRLLHPRCTDVSLCYDLLSVSSTTILPSQ